MTVPRTTEERYRLGQQQRKKMRRLEHGHWSAKVRKEDPLHLLEVSMRGRVKELAAVKWERMAASPFGYFRGAVPVMAYDLSLSANTGILNQICGDAHILNLGAYEGPSGEMVFDINDFDETTTAPFEWDLKRMAASLVLAGRQTGVKKGCCREAAEMFAARYRVQMNAFVRMPVLSVARHQVERLAKVGPVGEILKMAERATPLHSLETLTVREDPEQAHREEGRREKGRRAERRRAEGQRGDAKPVQARGKAMNAVALDPQDGEKATELQHRPGRIFRTRKPVLTRMTGKAAQHVVDALGTYAESLLPERQRFLAQFRPLDVAFKVVGTGSVGLRDYCIYMEGNGPGDPLFLQMKEEAASAYAPYVAGFGVQTEKAMHHQGRRVVEGQRAMQLQSDPLLGWTTIQGREYLVRQLNDHKAGLNVKTLNGEGLMAYAGLCGELLARGHARAGDCAALAGYLGDSERIDDALADFGVAYADQTERDHTGLVRWLKGRSV